MIQQGGTPLRETLPPPTPETAPRELPPLAPETAPVPETAREERPRTQGEKGAMERAAEGLKQKIRKPKQPAVAPVIRDALTMQVEKIMEENLQDAYKALSSVKQQELKIMGERTAYAIRQLLAKTRVKVKKIFTLLLKWLQLLPGVNRYFLEQEAKIKADKILSLKYRR